MWVVAVKQVTEFTVFGRDGASIRVLLEAENRLRRLDTNATRIDVFGTDFSYRLARSRSARGKS